jgi:hypothetical protein
MSNPFHPDELLYPLTKGDVAGHAFHGNQFTAGQGGGKDTADKIMDAVNKYGDEHPDAQMNKGWQTAMEQAKMIGEHKMAIPKSLVDSATKEDMDKLTDNNYHSARTAIEHQRPELADKPRTKEVDLGNYFKSESLLYPITKGDTPGHAFHGNQYSTEQAVADIKNGRAMLESALAKGHDDDPSNGSLADDDHMADARAFLSRGHAFLGATQDSPEHLDTAGVARSMANPDNTSDGNKIAQDTKTVIEMSKKALPV